MLIDYFVQKPQKRVNHLIEKMTYAQELKRQHQQAFKYRLKRFAVTPVGVASAFSAGAGYQALNSKPKNGGTISKIGQFSWLLRLL